MDHNPNAGERISQQQADEMMAAFKKQFPDATEGNSFGAHCFKELMSLPGCQVIVTMFGCDKDGNIKCIHRAADGQGNYLRDARGEVISFEIGEICPPICNK